MIRAFESPCHGSRSPLFGEGHLLHRGRHAANFLFGERTVTLSTYAEVLSPSTIIVDASELPEASLAHFAEDGFQTDRFRVELRRSIDLSLKVRLGTDPSDCAETIAPFVTVREHSISTALLLNRGHAVAVKGLEGFVVRKQAEIISGSNGLRELAHGLLGLGYGLTPSGDDFLVGITLVMNLLGRDAVGIRDEVLGYDNRFSRTMLLDALDGHYSSPVLALGSAMARGEGLEARAAELLGFGHSSGSDTLAGVLYALTEPSRLSRD
jgi:hypothetical protein